MKIDTGKWITRIPIPKRKLAGTVTSLEGEKKEAFLMFAGGCCSGGRLRGRRRPGLRMAPGFGVRTGLNLLSQGGSREHG